MSTATESLPQLAPLAVPLHIPDGINEADTLTAALAYADAGWHVLPVRLDHPNKSKRKSPGSVVGDNWPALSSRDPKVLTGWFAGTDYGIALHCGRSGAVVLDVDDYENVPDGILAVIETTGCPYQSTRADQPGRGHYLLANTTGRRIGNGLGKLATTAKWGEVRGANGVVLAAPSIHPDGGRYHWSAPATYRRSPTTSPTHCPTRRRPRARPATARSRSFSRAIPRALGPRRSSA